MAITWTDIGLQTRYLLSELSDTYVTDDVLIAAINNAVEKINSDTEINYGSTSIPLQSGVNEYLLDNDILQIYRIFYATSNATYTIKPTSLFELERDCEGWSNVVSTTPQKYYVMGNTLGLFPTPGTWSTYAANTDYEVGDLVVPPTSNGYIYKITAAGTSGGTLPTFPTDYTTTTTSGSISFIGDRADCITIKCLINPEPISVLDDTEPDWCPLRFRQTIAQCAAIEIATGWDVSGQVGTLRLQNLMSEYARDVGLMRQLSLKRAPARQGSIAPSGYRIFNRRV